MSLYKVNQEVLTSAQHSAGTGETNYVNASSYEYAMLAIYITGKSGSPTLDVALQCSPVDPQKDNTKWRTVYAEPQITNAMIGSPSATSPSNFGGHRQVDWSGWLRIIYTVGGASTPKLTFSANIELK